MKYYYFGNPINLSNSIYLNINDEKPKSLFNIEQKNENQMDYLILIQQIQEKGLLFLLILMIIKMK